MKRIFPGLMALFIGIVMVLPGTAPALADSGNIAPAEPAGTPALMIKVANTIQAGQPATITVFSRRSNETIAGAPVYAIKTSGRVVPADPGHYTPPDNEFESSDQFDGIEFDTLAGSNGISVGTTGSDGTLPVTLATAGRYLLIATKDGFIPGFARLQVKGPVNQAKLNIKADFNPIAGQPAAIQVTQKSNGQATENATVYALKVENNKDIKRMPPVANSSQAVIGLAGGDADRARQNGVLVGSTDSAGRVTYNFPTPGQYILAAFKAGYVPAFTRINIRQAAAVTPAPVPQPSTSSPARTQPRPVTQNHGDENEDD